MTTANTAAQTFAPQLEAIFDSAQETPVLINHDVKPAVAMSVAAFEHLVENAQVSVDHIKHHQVVRPEGKGNVIMMTQASYAEMLDAAQVASDISGDQITEAFDL